RGAGRPARGPVAVGAGDGRRAAHADRLGDAEPEVRRRLLQHHRAAKGELPRPPFAGEPAGDPHTARGGGEVPGEQAEHGGLPGAVGAHHGGERSGFQLERDAADQVVPVDSVSGVRGDHARLGPFGGRPGSGSHHALLFIRTIRNRKNGAPTAAVKSPMGISDGGFSVREAVSAAISSTEPAIADSGSSARCPGPVRIRTMCGTTRPTKPIVPAKATAAPVSSAVATTITARLRLTFRPRCCACRSPRVSTSSVRALLARITAAAAKTGTTAATWSHPALPSEPICQKVSVCSWASSAM